MASRVDSREDDEDDEEDDEDGHGRYGHTDAPAPADAPPPPAAAAIRDDCVAGAAAEGAAAAATHRLFVLRRIIYTNIELSVSELMNVDLSRVECTTAGYICCEVNANGDRCPLFICETASDSPQSRRSARQHTDPHRRATHAPRTAPSPLTPLSGPYSLWTMLCLLQRRGSPRSKPESQKRKVCAKTEEKEFLGSVISGRLTGPLSRSFGSRAHGNDFRQLSVLALRITPTLLSCRQRLRVKVYRGYSYSPILGLQSALC